MQITKYWDAARNLLQEERLEQESPGNRLVRFSSDARTGEHVSVDSAEGEVLAVRYRSSGERPLETAAIAASGKMIGKAMPQLILDRWQDLLAGSSATFDLVVPSRLETFRYRIRHDARSSSPGTKQVFVADADSWLIRQFAPALTFTFADSQTASDRRLLELVGPSPVEIDGKKYRTVHLVLLHAH